MKNTFNHNRFNKLKWAFLSFYNDAPHFNYVATNYGWYPDTLLTRIAKKIKIKKDPEISDMDLLWEMLDDFGTDYEILIKRKRIILNKDGAIKKIRPRRLKPMRDGASIYEV